MKSVRIFQCLLLLSLSGCGKSENAPSPDVLQAERKELLSVLADQAESSCHEQSNFTEAQTKMLGDSFKNRYCACAKEATLKQESIFLAGQSLNQKKFKEDLITCVAGVTNIPAAIIRSALSRSAK